MLMCVVMFSYTFVYNENSVEARIKQGEKGENVIEVQSKLKELGLYDGGVDGVYDVETAEAVKRFQEYNGLTANGVCGIETLKALGLAGYSYSDFELDVLARLIESEAGDTDLQTMTAVGAVVINRVHDKGFADSVLQVIYSGGSFDCIVNGTMIEDTPSELAYRAAEDAMMGLDPTDGALYVLHGGSYGKIVTMQYKDIYFAK